jgi:hypothetical protein
MRHSAIIRRAFSLNGLLPDEYRIDVAPVEISTLAVLQQTVTELHNHQDTFILNVAEEHRLPDKVAEALFDFLCYFWQLGSEHGNAVAIVPLPYLPPGHFMVDQLATMTRFSLKKVGYFNGEKIKQAFNYLYEDEKGNFTRQNYCDCSDNCQYSQVKPITADVVDELKKLYEIKPAKRPIGD